MLTVTLLSLLLATTEPAPAPAASPAPAEPAPKTKAERDKEKVCIDVTPTGTIMSKKVCKTRKQWRALQEAQQRAGESLLDTGSSDRQRRE
ncbi:MAG: hypothetical protein EON95_19470 [Caulobacteraceae bacterium]|nr:MAG: hypothetical protein EON95_19470 [Caulobacteraceae bacterium]